MTLAEWLVLHWSESLLSARGCSESVRPNGVTNGVKKLQSTVRSTVETCQTSFDPCVVNRVGFLLSPSYPQSVLDAHACRSSGLLKVRTAQGTSRGFGATL